MCYCPTAAQVWEQMSVFHTSQSTSVEKSESVASMDCHGKQCSLFSQVVHKICTVSIRNLHASLDKMILGYTDNSVTLILVLSYFNIT